MVKGKAYRYLLMGLILFAAITIWPATSLHASVARQGKKQESVARTHHLPNTELEIGHYLVFSAFHITAQKLVVKAELQAQYLLYSSLCSGNNTTPGITWPPEKEYLEHNYPSHNFW